MNKSINSILFNNLSKFSIPQNPIDIEYENINMALSVNRNLESYGYTLSTDAISALAKLPAQEICEVYNDLTDIIKEYKGIDEFNSVELFYPNFPEEVMDKSEEALYINSLLYYTFSQTDDERCKTIAQMIRDSVTEEKVDRLPLLENFPDKLKVINNTNIKELDELMINRIHAPKGMNEENLKDVETYFREYPFKIDQIVSTEIPYQSKENLVKTASLLYKLGARNSAVNMIKDSKDVLRFAAELSNQNFGNKVNDISLNTKKTVSNKNGKVKYKLNVIGKRCAYIPEKSNHYPVFDKNKDSNELLRSEAIKGINWRYPNGKGWDEEHQKRMEYELNIIIQMGFADYHLIVKDFLEYGRICGLVPMDKLSEVPLTIEGAKEYVKTHNYNTGIGIGIGRGSGAGSLVTYLLGITGIDPFKYNLIFERFLNPERVSMPKYIGRSAWTLTQRCA